MSCHSLLQGTFLIQGLNLGLLHCRQILYHLSLQGSPSSLCCHSLKRPLVFGRSGPEPCYLLPILGAGTGRLACCPVRSRQLGSVTSVGYWEKSAKETERSRWRGQRETGRLLRGTHWMLLKQQRVINHIKHNDGSSNRRSRSTGCNNVEVTVNLSKGCLNAEKGSKV